MFDLKVIHSVLQQLEEERGIPKAKMLEAIELALATAYKKEYGKKGQIVRAVFDQNSGKVEFYQVKVVVDESKVIMEDEVDEADLKTIDQDNIKVRFNPEHHILIADAKKIKRDAKLDDEIVFPLEIKENYGRIAAQTAKQVIIQKIREAERTSIIDEYGTKEGEIISGVVQKVERGNVYIDFNRATGILPAEEQIPGEYFSRGQRVRAYLYSVEDTPRGINLRLSRTHPKFIEKLFAIEAPEIQNGIVEIKSIAREAGARSKIAVFSKDEHIDPVGSCIGQRGGRINTIIEELGGEKIDIISFSDDAETYVAKALSPAKVSGVKLNETEKSAEVFVKPEQFSLAIGRGGQNVRLAAELTGWHIKVLEEGGTQEVSSDAVEGEVAPIEDTTEPEATAKVVEKEETTKTEETEQTAKEVKQEEVKSEEKLEEKKESEEKKEE